MEPHGDAAAQHRALQRAAAADHGSGCLERRRERGLSYVRSHHATFLSGTRPVRASRPRRAHASGARGGSPSRRSPRRASVRRGRCRGRTPHRASAWPTRQVRELVGDEAAHRGAPAGSARGRTPRRRQPREQRVDERPAESGRGPPRPPRCGVKRSRSGPSGISRRSAPISATATVSAAPIERTFRSAPTRGVVSWCGGTGKGAGGGPCASPPAASTTAPQRTPCRRSSLANLCFGPRPRRRARRPRRAARPGSRTRRTSSTR